MQKRFSILYSRTFWTFVAMFIIGGTNEIMQIIPGNLQVFLQLALAAFGTYFHINPSQPYNPVQ